MYVVHRDIIKDNVLKINEAFRKRDVSLMLCYSYKTNMMDCVIDIMNQCNVHPEVVSEYEYSKAPKNMLIICNGVAMSYEEIAEKICNDNVIVNFNDVESIKAVRELIDDETIYDAGLRIRFDFDSRFGILSDCLLYNAFDALKENKFRLKMLHCHVTGTRELKKYRLKVKKMIDVIIENKVRPDYIDFGGSMYGEMTDCLISKFNDVGKFDDYAEIIANEIKRLDYKPIVVLELGTALIANAVDIVGTVIRCDEYNRVVLDVTKYTFGMTRNKGIDAIDVEFRSSNNGSGSRQLYKVYGCSCIEDDLLTMIELNSRPQIGDQFVFKNCGAYSYCFEPEFIIPRRKVIVV